VNGLFPSVLLGSTVRGAVLSPTLAQSLPVLVRTAALPPSFLPLPGPKPDPFKAPGGGPGPGPLAKQVLELLASFLDKAIPGVLGQGNPASGIPQPTGPYGPAGSIKQPLVVPKMPPGTEVGKPRAGAPAGPAIDLEELLFPKGRRFQPTGGVDPTSLVGRYGPVVAAVGTAIEGAIQALQLKEQQARSAQTVREGMVKIAEIAERNLLLEQQRTRAAERAFLGQTFAAGLLGLANLARVMPGAERVTGSVSTKRATNLGVDP